MNKNNKTFDIYNRRLLPKRYYYERYITRPLTQISVKFDKKPRDLLYTKMCDSPLGRSIPPRMKIYMIVTYTLCHL